MQNRLLLFEGGAGVFYGYVLTSLFASLAKRPSSKPAWPTLWRVKRNEAEMVDKENIATV